MKPISNKKQSRPQHAHFFSSAMRAVEEEQRHWIESWREPDPYAQGDDPDANEHSLAYSAAIHSDSPFENLARELIARENACLETPNRYGDIALSSAASQALPDCVLLLLESGANPNGRDTDGDSLLHACAGLWEHEHFAASSECARILIRHGAEVDALRPYDEYTPLMVACRQGNLPMAQALAECGADIHHLAPDGKDALDCALSAMSPRARGPRRRTGPSRSELARQVADWLEALLDQSEILAELASEEPRPSVSTRPRSRL